MHSKLLYCTILIAIAFGVIALLNWIGGEKHLFFNKLREDLRKIKNPDDSQ